MYDFHLEAPLRAGKDCPAPVILFLHGAGESGGSLMQVFKHGPWSRPHPDPKQRSYRDNSRAAALIEQFYVLAPHLPIEGADWESEPLLELLDSLETQLPQLASQGIIATGLSRGGGGALRFAIIAPERIRALAVFCPENGAKCVDDIARLSTVPTWIFHNSGDRIGQTNPAQTETLFQRLEAVSTVGTRRTIFEADTHNCWRGVFEDPKLYEWFLDPTRWPGL